MKFTKTQKQGATPNLDPVALAAERALKRQRFLIARSRRKRRQRKSHQ